MRLGTICLVVIALSGPALAQHQHNQTPYAGLQQRPVKALSDQQLSDLRAGRGMGLALAGELNGYPGPLHVIELADQLALSSEQRQRMQQLFDAMKAEAIPVGETLIEQERQLDREFAEQRISPASLNRLTSQIGETQGKLRAVHLKYHLTTAELLSTHQRHRYAELRGYRN
jgi:LTXXQ motif family protein